LRRASAAADHRQDADATVENAIAAACDGPAMRAISG